MIDRAIALIVEEPERPSCRVRSDLAAGVHSFHVASASGRKRSASHVLYLTLMDRADHGSEVAILRVLHDRMEPRPSLVPADKPKHPSGNDPDLSET